MHQKRFIIQLCSGITILLLVLIGRVGNAYADDSDNKIIMPYSVFQQDCQKLNLTASQSSPYIQSVVNMKYIEELKTDPLGSYRGSNTFATFAGAVGEYTYSLANEHSADEFEADKTAVGKLYQYFLN